MSGIPTWSWGFSKGPQFQLGADCHSSRGSVTQENGKQLIDEADSK